MGSRKTLLRVVLLLVVAASTLSACGPASEEPADQSVSTDGERLLQDRCTECHNLNRVMQAEKTREEWHDTVTRMVNHGAELTEAEQAVLVDYLAQTYE
jgi:mono/diheme cytochrome c family protein